ncbi:hypothetical protein EDC65_3021 [Stella humosa]|uniref:Uncharacterized protein n=1 Tax=Stella humosa TaxID=94 RepID=A0A3N1LJW0_9PROT|nr:hypothetical protein [Stella humosa]ROP91158.1 hypothetical protein EDC65_3021 [Stella humosa]BBK34490.1 hypothetical protein STHU_51240 [Stella humosa]
MARKLIWIAASVVLVLFVAAIGALLLVDMPAPSKRIEKVIPDAKLAR